DAVHHSRLAPLVRAATPLAQRVSRGECPYVRPSERCAGGVVLLARCQQPCGGDGGPNVLPFALPPPRHHPRRRGAAVSRALHATGWPAGRAVGHLESLPRSASCRARIAGVLLDGTLLPVLGVREHLVSRAHLPSAVAASRRLAGELHHQL